MIHAAEEGTRSSASKKQRQDISVASGSSPPKGTRTKKSLQSPAVTGITYQVVTVTKQAKSSNDGNSTGDESAKKDEGSQNKESGGKDILTTQAKMSTPFDTKLEHVLNNYLSATRVDHDIRKAFIHAQIFRFEDFTGGCDVENIKTFQRDNNTSLVQAFSNVKLQMIGNVLFYY